MSKHYSTQEPPSVASQNDAMRGYAPENLIKSLTLPQDPPVIITSASNDKLTNLGRCRLRFKLGEETFEYYFQIIKNLKWDLILGLNFQKTFKISQDITDSNNLYLHIRNKIITFSTQSTNKKNYICTQECVQIKAKNWKQFRVKAPRNLKSGELYEIDFNGNGFPEALYH